MALPVVLATFSPYLTYRSPVYIAAGFAGVICLSMLVLQPLLAARKLPLHPLWARHLHRMIGITLFALTVVHVLGLYVTSPPDVIDALLLRAPTLFSAFGVIALWGITLTALVAALRRRLPARVWRLAHQTLSALVVVATVIHALQIEGAMEPVTKWIVSLAALLTTGLSLNWLHKRD